MLLLMSGPPSAAAQTSNGPSLDGISDVPLFRLFLLEGRSLVSVGEFARVGQQVVFLIPSTTTTENPPLQLVSIPADGVDWSRTDAYREAVRAQRYLTTQAEGDYEFLISQLRGALNDVLATADTAAQLAIVERARATLIEWASGHFGYKNDEVGEMLGISPS